MFFQEIDTVYLDGAVPEDEPPKMNYFIKYMLEADQAAATHSWASYLAGQWVSLAKTVFEDQTSEHRRVDDGDFSGALR